MSLPHVDAVVASRVFVGLFLSLEQHHARATRDFSRVGKLLSSGRFQLIAQSPDLILHRGKIVTVDTKFSIAEAVAIRDGRIVKVGSNHEILGLKVTATRVVNLGGRPVLRVSSTLTSIPPTPA
jgi:hypothetical protein